MPSPVEPRAPAGSDGRADSGWMERAVVLMSEGSGWTFEERPVRVWRAGLAEDLEPLLDELRSGVEREEDPGRRLAGLHGHFALVVDGPGFFLAAVDRNRSIPLFYSLSPEGPRVSNDPRRLLPSGERPRVSPDALRQIRMAGYTTGRKTAIEGVFQLLPGELLVWAGAEGGTRRERYYRYLPAPRPDRTRGELLTELARVTDEVFEGVVERAAGRPIWIPLSGGLDSRLVLCKLHEMGYPSLHTYSYGARGNHEARIARSVAERLGVPWEFVHLRAAEYRRFFWSSARREFWRAADGLASVPALQDAPCLRLRTQRGDIPADAVVINGQSGDYITGGHVPAALLSSDADEKAVVEAIIRKHFTLRTDLATPDVMEGVKLDLRDQLAEIRGAYAEPPSAAALYEAWEWQERQAKYVVNGVRMYDYAGLDWLMPLWHGHYMRFWESVPYQDKLRQGLYQDYLNRWDYEGLFDGFASPEVPWPGASILLMPVASVIGLVAGDRAKRWFYRRARYLGHYRFVYGIYGWKRFLARADVARNPVSFMADTWVSELTDQIERGELGG